MITRIKKRDGRIVTFNVEKIANAIFKAAESVGGTNYDQALEIAGRSPPLKRSRMLLKSSLLKRDTLQQQRHIFFIVQPEQE